MALAVYLSITACLTGMFISLYKYIFKKQLETKQRLAELEKFTTSGGEGSKELKTPLQKVLDLPIHRRVLLPFIGKLTHSLERLLPNKMLMRLEKEVATAGLSYKINFREVLVVYFLIVCAAIILGGGMFVLIAPPIWLPAVVVCSGLIIPRVWLTSKVKNRKEDIKRELPEFLDLLTVSVEAGLGFESALKKVAEEGGGSLAVEIKRVIHEISMGKSRKDALLSLRDRIDLHDLSTFINAIIQAEELGVGISRVLKVEAKEFRRKRRQRAEEQAMKAPVKLLIPLVLFIFPTIFIILLGPAALRITDVLFETF